MVPATVIGELHHGFRKGTKFEENSRKVREFLAEPRVEIHPVTFRTAGIYGDFVNHLQRQGTPVPTNDIRIAAAAHECRGSLASSDDHFRHLPDVDLAQDVPGWSEGFRP